MARSLCAVAAERGKRRRPSPAASMFKPPEPHANSTAKVPSGRSEASASVTLFSSVVLRVGDPPAHVDTLTQRAGST